jgi:hypothetical protein
MTSTWQRRIQGVNVGDTYGEAQKVLLDEMIKRIEEKARCLSVEKAEETQGAVRIE